MSFRFIILLLLTNTTLYAQQFSSAIVFSCQFNARDTVIIGYDALATDTIDALFNEVNIYTTQRDTGLDVRAGNIWGRQNISWYADQAPYQTRKQIAPNRCGTNTASIIELNIVSNNWPVYVAWEREEFRDSCRDGTSLTNMNPLTWWVGGGFREVLAIWNYHPIYPNQWYYIDNNDTVYTYWIGLGDSESVQLLIKEIQPDETDFRIYPNPASQHFHAALPPDFGRFAGMEIYSVEGILVLQSPVSDADISFLRNGVYYVLLYGDNRKRLVTKLIKSG